MAKKVRIEKRGSKLVLIRKKPNRKKGGLNKIEKKQTKGIVAAAIKKDNTLKYFDANSVDYSVSPLPSVVATAKKEVSMIAFSSTTEFDNTGTAVKFGPLDYVPLNLAKPYKENNADEALRAQALNGQYCLPKVAKCAFSIERVRYINDEGEGTPADLIDKNAARTLPIYYRIIKIGIKAQQGTQVVIDPNTDLFINSSGQPTGPDAANFDRLDMRYSPINTKKYTKLSDMTGVLQQNNVFTHNQSSGGSKAGEIITQKSGKSVTHFTVPFQLSSRKNGKLFYETPQQAGTGPNSFTSGGQRQLVIMMFTYENGHLLLGGKVNDEDQPVAPTSEDLQIKFKTTSAFVDTQ